MSLRHVLGVLDDREVDVWRTFDTAVRLADVQHARLTLTKTCEPGRVISWFGPFAAGAMYIPPDMHTQEQASHALARVAEFVPGCIPVTTLVLGPDTRRVLTRLLRTGRYDAFVASEGLLGRHPKLAREVDRCGARTVVVTVDETTPHVIGVFS